MVPALCLLVLVLTSRDASRDPVRDARQDALRRNARRAASRDASNASTRASSGDPAPATGVHAPSDRALGSTFEIEVEPVTGGELVLLPAGRFRRGSLASERGRGEDETSGEVQVERAFWMGRREVTRGAWTRVMGEAPEVFASCGDDCPVVSVNAYDVDEFLRRLERLSHRRYRLPTENEWEYACKAGSDAPFLTGARLTPGDANVEGSFPGPERSGLEALRRAGPLPVGSFSPSAWGLHDMHGNVWEWTSDTYAPYAGERTTLSSRRREVTEGSAGGALRVIRGGSFYFGASSARCALRYTHREEDCGFSLGFRLARDVSTATEQTPRR